MTKQILSGECNSKRGRPTIEDDWLGANRDALLNMFVFGWPEVGWNLARACTRDALRIALQPLKDHANRQYIHRLLQKTEAKGEESEIKSKGALLGKAVEQMHVAQSHSSECINRCREIEAALIQATGDQSQVLLELFSARRVDCQAAQNQSRSKSDIQSTIEKELIDEEAAYAQDQLLKFIVKGKYAFHPLNIANAVAGLPWAIGVPFMGVWQSHARCSKLEVPGWPHYRYVIFKTIQKAWEEASSSSPEVITKVFEKIIRALPKIVTHEHAQMGTHKVENYARTFLCQNWYWLKLAMIRSLEAANDDDRPPYFVIASSLDKLLESSKTPADSVIADSQKLRD